MERRECKESLVFCIQDSIPLTPVLTLQKKSCRLKNNFYLTGIRETDSRIRRIVKEGSAGTPLSPIVEFGNNLNEIRERLVYRLAVIFESACLAL